MSGKDSSHKASPGKYGEFEEDFGYDYPESFDQALARKSRYSFGELRKRSPLLTYGGIGVLVILTALALHLFLIPLGVTSLVNNQMTSVSSTYADAIKDRETCALRAIQQLGLKDDGSSARTPITDAVTGLYGNPVMMERTQFLKDLAKAYPTQTPPSDALVRTVNREVLQECFEVFQGREADINATVNDLVANKTDWVVHLYGPKQYPNNRLVLDFGNGLPPITGDQALAYLMSDDRSWPYRPTSTINTVYLIP